MQGGQGKRAGYVHAGAGMLEKKGRGEVWVKGEDSVVCASEERLW